MDETINYPESLSLKVIFIIIIVGIILRLVRYYFNGFLSGDELFLTYNILHRSYSGFFQPLSLNQGAPIGFLILEKLIANFIGNNEYALKSLPLLCGIISIFLFYKIAKNCIDSSSVPIALFFFALCPNLIYYSSEVKQYSSDVTVALTIILITIYAESKNYSYQSLGFMAFLGALAVWFSHPAIIILTSIAISLTLIEFQKKDWPKLIRLYAVFLFWLVSFGICYFFFLRKLESNRYLFAYWENYFLSFPPTLADAKTFLANLTVAFTFTDWRNNYLFNYIPKLKDLRAIFIIPFIIGCITCYFNKKDKLYLLIFPIIITIITAMLHKYPFGHRLGLFLVPLIILLVAQGLTTINAKLYNYKPVYGNMVLIIILLWPLLGISQLVIKPASKENINPALAYVERNIKNGDKLYIYYGAQPAFNYYYKDYRFNNNDIIYGIAARDSWQFNEDSVFKGNSEENWQKYDKDLDKLRQYKRVWIIFYHFNPYEKKYTEKDYFIDYLNKIGRIKSSFKAKGSFAYLYEF